jgi:lathosterol oxidase
MTTESSTDDNHYKPNYRIETPPLYDWPPHPIAAFRWLFFGLLFPWGFFFIALAVVAWLFLTPTMATMSNLSVDWIALIWIRNAVLLTMVAGSLHWWLYSRQSQAKQYKFQKQWLTTDNPLFLWGNQVWDNMFWSLISGVTIWTFFEVITLWIYASGKLPFMSIAEHPVYFITGLLAVFFWSTIHFYFNHRLLHWQPLYKISHELHHRNVNIGPWTGISMHPLEHAIYFTLFMLWWVVPVHPIIILLTGFYQGISPAISHSGFDQVILKGKTRVSTGDWFHELHHQYFNFNYGNTPTPLDKLFGSWHDGSAESLQFQKLRLRKNRRKANAPT